LEVGFVAVRKTGALFAGELISETASPDYRGRRWELAMQSDAPAAGSDRPRAGRRLAATPVRRARRVPRSGPESGGRLDEAVAFQPEENIIDGAGWVPPRVGDR
jgi:hypothetical protein